MANARADNDRAFRLAVGKRIHNLRLALGLNQLDFARLIGIPAPTLNQQEGGLYLPSIQYALAIDKATNCSLDYIYKGTLTHVPSELLSRIVALAKNS